MPDAGPVAGSPADILCLPQPEWVPNELTVGGAPADLVAFRAAAAGPGLVAWQFDHDRLEEDWVHAMMAPPPGRRDISLAGARILARQLRDIVEQRAARAAEAAFGSTACPLDLNALLPVPDRVLRLGPDDPAALRWLWENWGTTWPLRGVEELPSDFASSARSEQQASPTPPSGPLRSDPTPGSADARGGGDAARATLRYRFWSADWSPWRAVAAMRARWSALTFQVSVRAVSE